MYSPLTNTKESSKDSSFNETEKVFFIMNVLIDSISTRFYFYCGGQCVPKFDFTSSPSTDLYKQVIVFLHYHRAEKKKKTAATED